MRPAAKRPRSGSLLDDILGKTTQLYASVRNTRVGDDSLEVASPYIMAQPAPGEHGKKQRNQCRMPECNSTVFDIDMRHGDRVCVSCGTVQNQRSLESQEEEHRTFADDDKAESKKRAEINDGKQGGKTGDASLRTANALANGEMQKEDRKLDAWKHKVKDLAGKMELPSSIKETALNYCTVFGESVKLHDELCKDKDCRLRKGILQKKPDFIAASVLQYALREGGLARQFQTFAHHMTIGEDKEKFRSEVGQVFGLVNDHITQYRAKNYTCVTGDNKVVANADDTEQVEKALVQITSLIFELCQKLKLHAMVRIRAEAIYGEWYKHGTRTALPQTIAAAAIWMAARELAPTLRDCGGKELAMADLTLHAGVAEGTIMKFLKEVPPPSTPSMLGNATASSGAGKTAVKTER